MQERVIYHGKKMAVLHLTMSSGNQTCSFTTVVAMKTNSFSSYFCSYKKMENVSNLVTLVIMLSEIETRDSSQDLEKIC